jgi:hypothetical protein
VDLRRRYRRLLGPDIRDDLGAAVGPWLVSRALVALAYVVARLGADEVDAQPLQLSLGLFAWDGDWYRGIAEVGYGGLPDEAIRFFPLFPLLGRLVGILFLGREWLGLVVVANLGALAAAVVLRRLVIVVGGDREIASRAVWLLLLSPAAFVLVWSYSEAIFLSAAVAAFIALRRRLWWWAGALGAAAALARPVGVLLAGVALIEALRAPGVVGVLGRAGRSGRVAAVVGPVLGLAGFLLWAEASTGDWRDPIRAQSELRGDLAFPFARLVEGIGEVFGGEFNAALHVGAAVVFAALVVVAFFRLPLSLAAFAAAMFVVATSAEHLTSLERYALGAFPVTIAAAMVLRRPVLERSAIVLSGAAMVGLAVLAWLGAYTP